MSGDTAWAAEYETESLAAELCKKAHPDDPAKWCEECYSIAVEVMDTEWAASRVLFTPEHLTMLHRAVRQKLRRTKSDIARDRRRGGEHRLFFAQGKAHRMYDYAGLLQLLDSMVPEERR